MNSAKNLVLTGFMATGKTTIAQGVAQALGREWVDMDALIVERTLLAIPDIFARYGESHFRTIEKGLCYELALRSDLVVSTGGGALIDADNRQVMLAHTCVVCLTATPETIAHRLAQEPNHRPLAPQWETLLAQRTPIYNSLSYRVATDELTPEQLVTKVLALWNDCL